MMNRPHVAFVRLSCLLLTLAATFSLHGDPSRDYRKGMQAFRGEDFTAAAQAFRAAISDDRKEGVQKLRGTGVSFDDYFPHLYLGLCLEHTGQTAEAIAALEESERQGAVFDRPELRRSLHGALSRLRAVRAEPPPKPAAPTPVPPTQSPLPPSLPPTATALPVRAQVPTELPWSSRQPTATAVQAAGRLPVATPSRTLPAPARTATDVSGAELTALRSGVESFFRGRYDDAVSQLRPLAEHQPMAQLFLAYALASRTLLMKTPEASTLAAARGHYKDSRSRGARLPDPDLVPPKVVALLEGGEASR